jgi:hypothetical protein
MKRVLLALAPALLCASRCHDDFDDPDITPPANITDLAASGDPVVLTWTNPPDSDLDRVWIRKRTGGFPANHEDGELIFSDSSAVPGAPDSFTDTAVVSGETYYYAIFSVDDAGN